MKNRQTLTPQTTLSLRDKVIATVTLGGFGAAVMALSLLLHFRPPQPSAPAGQPTPKTEGTLSLMPSGWHPDTLRSAVPPDSVLR